MSPQVAVLRVLRASRILGMGDVRRQLMGNAAYQRHIAVVAKDDAVFFLSHRHYLARGLTSMQRAATALHHYEHEVNAFDAGYFDAVYRGHGLVVWRAEVGEDVFDIRLMPGNDVLYEGGVSLVMHHNGGRIAVVSYANVPAEIFAPDLGSPDHVSSMGDQIIFVTRKQLTADHSYQKAFNKAFDRSTPGHFGFAALSGIALAQGLDRVAAISPEAHPSCSAGLEKHFQVAYTDFWESLSGRRESPFGYIVDVPMRMTPLDELDAKARKRAQARRAHLHEIQEGAQEIIRRHLRQQPPIGGLGTRLRPSAPLLRSPVEQPASDRHSTPVG
jgi:uncharacterized protein